MWKIIVWIKGASWCWLLFTFKFEEGTRAYILNLIISHLWSYRMVQKLQPQMSQCIWIVHKQDNTFNHNGHLFNINALYQALG